MKNRIKHLNTILDIFGFKSLDDFNTEIQRKNIKNDILKGLNHLEIKTVFEKPYRSSEDSNKYLKFIGTSKVVLGEFAVLLECGGNSHKKQKYKLKWEFETIDNYLRRYNIIATQK